MPTKVKVDLKLKKFILNATRRMSKGLDKSLEKNVLNSIARGVSPVARAGKFKKYSKSYKDQIRGKITFRTFNGRVVPIILKTKAGRTKLSDNVDKIRKENKKLFGRKRTTPVNLKLSGDLLKSITSKVNRNTGVVEIAFKSDLADIHTNQGAGQSKVIRKMLPQGKETFNKNITDNMTRLMRKKIRKFIAKRK